MTTFRWCSMHVLNLGVALWVVGSCFKQILADFPGVWGTGDDSERLREAHETFKSWTHRHRVPTLASCNSCMLCLSGRTFKPTLKHLICISPLTPNNRCTKQEHSTSLYNCFFEVSGWAVSGVAGKGLQRCSIPKIATIFLGFGACKSRKILCIVYHVLDDIIYNYIIIIIYLTMHNYNYVCDYLCRLGRVIYPAKHYNYMIVFNWIRKWV